MKFIIVTNVRYGIEYFVAAHLNSRNEVVAFKRTMSHAAAQRWMDWYVDHLEVPENDVFDTSDSIDDTGDFTFEI